MSARQNLTPTEDWNLKDGEFLSADLCRHTLRNPHGATPESVRSAGLSAAIWMDRYEARIKDLQAAYDNMRDWAEQNGVDTVARNM